MKSNLSIKGKLTPSLIPGPNHKYSIVELIRFKYIPSLRAISLKIRGR